MPVILDANADTVAGIAKFVGTLVGTIFLVLVKPWLEKRKERKMLDSLSPRPARDGGRVADELDTAKREIPEDTAIAALRRIAHASQRDADALRDALRLSERESQHLRAQLAEAAQEHTRTASELAAKVYALESTRGVLDVRTARLGEVERECVALRKLVEELRERLNELTGSQAHPIRVPEAVHASQRPTPRSGLHAMPDAVPVMVPGLPPVPGELRRIGHDDTTPPRARPLPKRPRKP